MSCGLKNSLCQGSSSPTTPGRNASNTLEERFSFVDGGEKDGLWTVGIDYGNITCPVGGIVVFHYPTGSHDIVELNDREDWEACQNLESAIVLSPRSTVASEESNHDFEDVSYYYHCDQPGTTAYLTCSVPGHCEAQQKVTIQTSATEFAFDRATGDWLLHVKSLSRVLQLLGYRLQEQEQPREASPGSEPSKFVTVTMNRGFQTEELANETTNLIWCALDHCPSFSRDFDPIASQNDCESTVLTLLGYVNRKRPLPQWNVSEDYYREAIEKGGKNTCTAQSYLSQLFMSKGDFAAAATMIQALCVDCALEQPNIIFQTKQEYSRLGISGDQLDFSSLCEMMTTTNSSYGIRSIHTSMYASILLAILVSFRLSRN